jgi:ribose transport system permease protein
MLSEGSNKYYNLKEILISNSLVFIMIGLLIFFSLTTKNYLSYTNIMNVLTQVSTTGIVAIGSAIVLLIGGIDLSPDAVIILSGVVAGGFVKWFSMNIVIALLFGLLAGALVGLFNGVIIEVIKVNAVVVTLGTMMGIRGVAQLIMEPKGSWISLDHPFFVFIASKKIGGFFPFLVLVLLLMYAITYLFLNKSTFGRSIYAIGNNQSAAILCGLRTTRIKVGVYVVAGLLSGIAGIVLNSRTGIIVPAVGEGMVFQAITAAILGGISLKGGIGRIQMVFVAVIILGLISNWMTLIGISAYYRQAVNGSIILIAALSDRFTSRGT